MIIKQLTLLHSSVLTVWPNIPDIILGSQKAIL